MAFWRRGTARDVKNVLLDLNDRLEHLKDFDRQREKVMGVVAGVLADLEIVEREIPVRAEDIKSRPWIDARFDAGIDKLAESELRSLERLKKDIELWGSMAASAERTGELAAVAQALVNEGKEIRNRDESFAREVEWFKEATRKSRLSKPSLPAPAGRTSDGVAFGNITRVVREVGGRMAAAPRGTMRIVFPGGASVLLTPDLSSRRIAESVSALLRTSNQGRKILGVEALLEAFRAGDVSVLP